MIAAYVSSLNGCRYCRSIHTQTAEKLGAPTGMIAELVDDLEGAAIEPKMRPVLRYARKLTRDPAGLTQADADAIIAAGWNDKALYDLVAVTALFNFMNRLVEGLGIAPSDAYAGQAAERLATRGYKPLIDMVARAAT